MEREKGGVRGGAEGDEGAGMGRVDAEGRI